MIELVYDGSLEQEATPKVFSSFMEQQLEQDPDVVYCDADLMALIGMRDLWKRYPERVLDTGIQEANMIGVGAGLSTLGLKPYLHSFAAFVTRRAFDQIFISGAYSGNTLHIIGSEPGIKQDFNGGTHMNFEDIAMMRTIPHCHIFEITDHAVLRSVLEQTKDERGIFYYRLPMAEIPKIYSDASTMQVGKGNILREGTDASIIASGALVAPALDAAKLLQAEGISVRVVDMFTVKPLDEALVVDCANKTGAIVTAENASYAGGLGEAVSDCITENCPVVMRHVAVRDEFGEVGPESYLFKRYGFTAENLRDQVKSALIMKHS